MASGKEACQRHKRKKKKYSNIFRSIGFPLSTGSLTTSQKPRTSDEVVFSFQKRGQLFPKGLTCSVSLQLYNLPPCQGQKLDSQTHTALGPAEPRFEQEAHRQPRHGGWFVGEAVFAGWQVLQDSWVNATRALWLINPALTCLAVPQPDRGPVCGGQRTCPVATAGDGWAPAIPRQPTRCPTSFHCFPPRPPRWPGLESCLPG